MIHINDGSVSSHHAEIISDGSIFHLHDLGSTNGTFINGEQITDAVLNPNDEIRFGGVAAVFLVEGIVLTDAQPLPASSAPPVELAHESARPENFVSSSPIPRNVKKKDPLALAAMALGGLGLLVAGGAAAMAFLTQA
jgi:pSer/pThr/pTyr-binding forkhead associated (FHA) protein